MSDTDARLVDLYDGDNPDGPDHDFYRALADRIDARGILDLGCGTGILSVTFAREGRRVVGVDPSPAMLRVARTRHGTEHVEWIDGDSTRIPEGLFDLTVMTGNVAQHIPDDAWMRTLRDVRRALHPGGTLAFETRNPDARAWEQWTAGPHSVRETAHGRLEEWMTLASSDGRMVGIDAHTVFLATREHVVERMSLVFRSRDELERDLDAAGFVVGSVCGDWQDTPFAGGPLMVFVARAA